MDKDDLGSIERVKLHLPAHRQPAEENTRSLKANEKSGEPSADSESPDNDASRLLPWDFSKEGGIETSLAETKAKIDGLRTGVREKLRREYLTCGRIYLGLLKDHSAWNIFTGLEWTKKFCPERTEEGRLDSYRFVLARVATGIDAAGRKKASKAAIALTPLIRSLGSEDDILKIIDDAGGIQKLADRHAKKNGDGMLKCFGEASEALLKTRDIRVTATIMVIDDHGKPALQILDMRATD